MGKKALSPIIATVLLIAITLSLFGVVFGIVVPLVEEKTSDAKCFDYLDYIQILNSEYTCYNESSEKTSLEISRNLEKKEIIGIFVVIKNQKESKTFRIYENKTGTECDLTSIGVSEDLGYNCAPKPGESITYDFDFQEGESAYLSIELDENRFCDEISKILNIKKC